MMVLEREIIPKLVSHQQVISATTMLCEDNFRGMVQRMLLGHARDLIDVSSTTTTAPSASDIAVPPLHTQSQYTPQTKVQIKKRPASLSDLRAISDVGSVQALKRSKKDFQAEKGTAHTPSTKIATYCVCKTTDDHLLVQCDGCDKWYHPVCVGKSACDAATIQQHRRWAMEMDVAKLAGNVAFRCLDCDEKDS